MLHRKHCDFDFSVRLPSDPMSPAEYISFDSQDYWMDFDEIRGS